MADSPRIATPLRETEYVTFPPVRTLTSIFPSGEDRVWIFSAAAEPSGMKTAANAIGYKELIPYFEGKAELSDCIAIIKQETRRYAKRQLTWFRKNGRIEWLFLDRFNKNEEILEKCKKTIANYF
jgi:tRNA A37 N6-isopentenylltransferase MiaA